MASLQLPPPRKSPASVRHHEATSITSSFSRPSLTATTADKQQQQQEQAHPQLKDNNTQQHHGVIKTKPTGGNPVATAPSYEERCRAAREVSKLTIEQRKSRPPLFVPRRLADFDDGGAFPEIHVAQYPRHMGNPHLKKKNNDTVTTGSDDSALTTSSNSRAIINVEIGKDGKVSYDAIVKGGTNSDKIVYSKLEDMKGIKPKEADIALPTAEEEQEEASRTQAALMSLLSAKTALDKPSGSAMINAATSMNVETKTKFIKYSAREDAPGYNPAASASRVIQMVPAQIDPMMPPKHKHIKAPRGPAEDPVPVLQAPPRKLTKEERNQWNIPACISNWKNSRGYTIPLDKRLAADGRGLIDTSINSNQFAALSESLYVAEQQARQEVRMRALIQKKQLLAERTQREEELRQLANQARLERSNMSTASAGTGYGDHKQQPHDNESYQDDDNRSEASSVGNNQEGEYKYQNEEAKQQHKAHVIETDDDIAARQREKLRLERKRERERELRLEKNIEAKKKQKLEEERDVSEKIALGIHTGTGGGGGGIDDIDSRLHNQSSGFDSGFGAEDEYNAYTKPLFSDRTAGPGTNSIYRPTANNANNPMYADDQYDKLVQEGVSKKFQPEKGFRGSSSNQSRTEPVQFEKETNKR